MRRGPRSGLYTIVAVHSTVRGPALGGCRLWSYADSRDAVADALRLSRAMTFKAAVADLPQGGGKGVIMRPTGGPLEGEARRAALLDFGDSIEMLDGRYRTAEDVGTSDPDMTVISERTSHVTGLAVERGGSGDPSPWTALGVQEAIRVACERVWGSPDLDGRTIAVVGLGRVGGALARGLSAAGARLVVADVDQGKHALADELGADWTDPASAIRAEVDVLAPCALGAMLDAESVPALRCRAIAGAANNQLASEEIAERLIEREIVWTPDFVANAGGIINIAVELEPEGYAPERAEGRVLAIGDTLRTIFDDAEAAGTTPLAAAMALASRRLAAASAPPPAASPGAPPA
ncbi:MAG: Glu/Leu/Phe/Val dehydrogenase dimerization domain-containing protein [Solirubrobacteraceae bacterium]